MSKRTSLFRRHQEAGAKIVDFAGWEMPITYTSILPEHTAVRERAGLFDVSHMGQITVEGKESLPFLQKICTNDISLCKQGHGIYSHLCNENGGVIDDIFVYFVGSDQYLVVVNAATIEKDWNWFLKNKSEGLLLNNKSDSLSMVALQGPLSEKVLSKLFQTLPSRHQVSSCAFEGESLLICRTGYTGEDGFEMIVPNPAAEKLWDQILSAGKEWNVVPCGLGARDTLRLEAGYLLYGQDVDDAHTSVESGPQWVIKFNKDNFIGKESLLQQEQGNLQRKLMAFKCLERGIPRHGATILKDGNPAGIVTSGSFSPSLRCGIALGYVPPNSEGKFAIECSGKSVAATITKLPFYKKGE
ncbi:MAG: glycine cleavage system aminomethyltransferase GcvT [Elusimicrobia bacterium]|nr:glycine cleavage system aminomethyltransferase GcvT [Elusimicrobiota bacterium]